MGSAIALNLGIEPDEKCETAASLFRGAIAPLYLTAISNLPKCLKIVEAQR